MSFTLQLWQKPEEWPWPTSYHEAEQQVGCLLIGPPPGQNPLFLEFGRGLYERFAEDSDVWLDGSECGETDAAVLVFGITTGRDEFDDAYGWAIEVAARLGLVLTDPQTGDTFLPDGQCIAAVQDSMPAPMPSVRHLVWDELRSAAVDRQPEALYELGRRLRYGLGGQRRHLWVSYALLRLGAHDEASRTAADERWQHVGEQNLPQLQALHDRLANAHDGTELLAIVDAERQMLDDDFTNAQRDLLDVRTWEEGVDGIFESASAGHEIAAYQAALCSLITEEPPNWQGFDTWSRIAAEWGHEPACELRHHVLARGIAQPGVDPDPAKAAWWLEQLAIRPREWPTEGDALAQIVAWYAHEELPPALFTRGTQLENKGAGLKRDRTRALDCYIRAAEQGHADATYNVAVLLETAKVPSTLTAALLQLAQSRGSQRRAEGLDVSGAEKERVRSMMRELARPGRLRAVIRTYARTPAPETAPPSVVPLSVPAQTLEATLPQAEKPSVELPVAGVVPLAPPTTTWPSTLADPPTPSELEGRLEEPGPSSASRGNRWLLIPGMIGLPLMLTLARPGDGFRLGMVLCALLAGWGVWRYAGQRQWATVKRLVLAALAALPVGGMVVSALLLAQSFQT
jgi:TPR repeat protein